MHYFGINTEQLVYLRNYLKLFLYHYNACCQQQELFLKKDHCLCPLTIFLEVQVQQLVCLLMKRFVSTIKMIIS